MRTPNDCCEKFSRLKHLQDGLRQLLAVCRLQRDDSISRCKSVSGLAPAVRVSATSSSSGPRLPSLSHQVISKQKVSHVPGFARRAVTPHNSQYTACYHHVGPQFHSCLLVKCSANSLTAQ